MQFDGKEAVGNLRLRSETENPPVVHWNVKQGSLYTLLIWDPDALQPSWIHLFIVNLPSTNLIEGQTLLSYTPPTPPSGTHKYYVTLFEQPQRISVQKPQERGNFNVNAFVQQHGLRKLHEKMIQVRA